MMDDSDTAVMLAACGDAPARFGQVFERHHGAVWAYLARLCGPEAADELAGEVFVAAFARRHHYDPMKGELRPWLFGIATNLVRRHGRDEERRLRALGRIATDGAAGEPALPASPEVGAALVVLEPGDRDVVLLIAWEDLSYDQVAAALDIPVGTVRSRLHRARRLLREQLAAHLDPEDTHG